MTREKAGRTVCLESTRNFIGRTLLTLTEAECGPVAAIRQVPVPENLKCAVIYKSACTCVYRMNAGE